MTSTLKDSQNESNGLLNYLRNDVKYFKSTDFISYSFWGLPMHRIFQIFAFVMICALALAEQAIGSTIT